MKTTTRSERQWWRTFVFRFWIIGPMIVLAIGSFAGPMLEEMGYDNWLLSPIVVGLMSAMITVGVVWLLYTALTRPDDPEDRSEPKTAPGGD